MCGIAGIIHKNAGKDVNIGEQMTAMLQALKHRGPDSTGYAMYGEDNGNNVVRFKVAEAVDLEGSFDIHAAIEDRVAAVNSRMEDLGAKIVKKESATEYSHRYEIQFSGDMKKLADFVEDIEGHSLCQHVVVARCHRMPTQSHYHLCHKVWLAHHLEKALSHRDKFWRFERRLER